MENNLILAILKEANKRAKGKSAVYSEMIERHYEGADDFGKEQINKILMNLTRKDVNNLLNDVETEEADIVIEAELTKEFLGYKIGAKIIAMPNLMFGLIRNPEEEQWYAYVSTNKPKIQYIELHEEGENGELYVENTAVLSMLLKLLFSGVLKSLPTRI